MINIIIAVFIVIIVMIALVFWILKRMINTLNEQSKGLFVNKLQTYDELINLKEAELEKLKAKIEELSNIKQDNEKTSISNNEKATYYETKNLSYKDSNLLENYRKINEKFNINAYQIVNDFIKKYWIDESKEQYDMLKNIKEKFDDNKKYEFLIMGHDDQLENLNQIFNNDEQQILKQFLKTEDNFEFLDFLTYVDDLIIKSDPTVYVNVGNNDCNFDKISKFIKTGYDSKIYIGVQIIYKNKLYDYSIS